MSTGHFNDSERPLEAPAERRWTSRFLSLSKLSFAPIRSLPTEPARRVTGDSRRVTSMRRGNVVQQPRVIADCSTLILATVASLVLTLARLETALSPLVLFGEWLIWLSVPWIVWSWDAWHGSFAGGMTGSTKGMLRWRSVWVTSWILLPILAELVWRAAESGSAFELTLLVCFQNAALMTAAFPAVRRCQQISCLLSGFLTLFAIVVRASLDVFFTAAIFGVLLLWWLMARYWERVRQTHVAAWEERCWPMRGGVLLTVGVGAGLILCAVGSTGASTYALRGFMPTSGGEIWNDAAARSGVGDGDALVAAQDQADSFGPVESELFLESEMPSLFDMFSDLYGDPPKPRKKQERNIALAPNQNVDTQHQHRTETQRSGREFATVRRPSHARRTKPEDRAAPAMLYVVGPVPLHLALERFTEFDGRLWTHGSPPLSPPRPLTMRTDWGRAWVELGPTVPEFLRRETEQHAVKIINLKSNRIPSPPQLTALSIDRVDQLDFFGWSLDEVVEMPVRDHVPQLTIVRLRSHGRNLEALRADDAGKWFRRHSWDCYEPPSTLSPLNESNRLQTSELLDDRASFIASNKSMPGTNRIFDQESNKQPPPQRIQPFFPASGLPDQTRADISVAHTTLPDERSADELQTAKFPADESVAGPSMANQNQTNQNQTNQTRTDQILAVEQLVEPAGSEAVHESPVAPQRGPATREFKGGLAENRQPITRSLPMQNPLEQRRIGQSLIQPSLNVLNLTVASQAAARDQNRSASEQPVAELDQESKRIAEHGKTDADPSPWKMPQSVLRMDQAVVKRHAELARQWTMGLPRGWRQVEAIVGQLRAGFELDPQASIPENCEDVVEHFLRTRRGPDYLFATTAAILLRGLDYPTRLVTGFYARPERLDRRAGQTAVLAEDVHVWVEVGLDRQTWLAIEPTPGYEPPREVLSWKQQILWLATAGVGWAKRNGIMLAALTLVLGLAWRTRLYWLDMLYTVWLTRLSGRRANRQVLHLLRLLEWRGWLAGRHRPATIPLSTWYGQLVQEPLFAAPSPDLEPLEPVMRRFLGVMERVLYAPCGEQGEAQIELVDQDRQAIKRLRSQLTAKRLRAARG